MLYNVYSTLELYMMFINEFDFAKNNIPVGHAEISSHSFFRIQATTSILSHGDHEPFDRIFLIAAPSHDHARVWVEQHYLIATNCKTYEELKEAIAEQTITDDTNEWPNSSFVGCVDVGDYKYRRIDDIIEITKEYAELMYMKGDFYESNLASKPFG